MQYTAVLGAHIKPATARDVGKVIDRLESRDEATPDRLVQEARKASSPAHKHFEWNDRKAGAKYRIEQAKYYLRSITIVEEDVEDRGCNVPLRTWFPTEDSAGKRSYRNVERIKRDADMMSQVLMRAYAAIESWTHQYEALRKASELSGVFAAVDEARAKRKKGKKAA